MDRKKLALWAVAALVLGAVACNVPERLAPPALLDAATPTPIPTVTVAPTETATATPTPPPTPTPTPDPAERLADAGRAMQHGDYATAADVYQRLLGLLPEEGMAAEARLGLGTAYLRDGDYASAAGAFRGLLSAHPESELAPDARFLLGEALAGGGESLAAADAYQAYLAAGTVITAYVERLRGDALVAGGAYLTATQAYEGALVAPPDLPFEVNVREKLALAHVALEDYPAALAQYDAILDVAQVRAYRARIEHQAAETLILAGEAEDGYDRHLAVVETYPDEYYAYLSLVELVEVGRPVDDYLRGVVDYYGGAYGPAVEAFYRYMRAYPETYLGDAHWYVGRSYLAAGNPDLAAAEFQALIEGFPESRRVGDGWMGLAEAHADAGDEEAAVEAYRGFVEALPDHLRAPEALWEAAWLAERDGDLAAAAEGYLDCHVAYPDSDYGAPALFRSGLQSYQLDELADAAVAWDTLAELYPDSPYRPAARLWLGKLRLAQGDPEVAGAAFRDARDADPSGYYGLRAGDLGRDPLSAPFPVIGYAPVEDAAAGRAEAEEWLAGWLGLEDSARVGELGPDLAVDGRYQRGLALWRLGQFVDGKDELEALRGATASDALAQYRLALLFRDIGLYRSSILCAARVVYLSPAGTVLEAPAFIARLAYPTYYEGLALEDAERADLDTLLVFALIRQESLFESLATSTASAHGLMQVIPGTGAQIAAELGWPPDYVTGDLYRPYVSLRFGTYYLAQQRDRFDGRVDVALAAYNGGPLNAARWLERGGEDPDLFLEMITFRETRLYLQRVREHLAVYRALYGAD